MILKPEKTKSYLHNTTRWVINVIEIKFNIPKQNSARSLIQLMLKV